MTAEGFGTSARQPRSGPPGRQCTAAPAGPRSTYSESVGVQPGPGPGSESLQPEGRETEFNICLRLLNRSVAVSTGNRPAGLSSA